MTLRFAALVIGAAAVSACFPAAAAPSPAASHEKAEAGLALVKAKLHAFAARDTRVRAEWEENPNDPGALVQMKHLREESDQFLSFFLADGKLPGIKEMGEDGVNDMFQLMQHVDDLPTQRKLLAKMETAMDGGNWPRRYYANLYDLIQVEIGKPQRFGTQFFKNYKEELEPYPIEDQGKVDEYRARYGLPPLKVFLKFAAAVVGQDQFGK